MDDLSYMGVLFEEKSLEDLQQAYSFHQALCLERSPQRDWDSLLAEIPFGVEEARKLNLSYGLKSFLEPGGDFCTFDREGAVLPSALGEGQETCSQQVLCVRRRAVGTAAALARPQAVPVPRC